MILDKKIKIPIYFGSLRIIIFNSDSELLEKHDFGEEWNNRVSHFGAWVSTLDIKNDVFTVFVRDNSQAHTLAHEAAHLVHQIFKDRGVSVSYDMDEHYCYLLGWIVNEMDKCLIQYKKKEDAVDKKD